MFTICAELGIHFSFHGGDVHKDDRPSSLLVFPRCLELFRRCYSFSFVTGVSPARSRRPICFANISAGEWGNSG